SLSWPNLVERGSVGMSFLAGLSTSTTPLEFWGTIVAILAAGVPVGAQVSAALMFVFVSFAIAEIPLVGYLASPAKTQAVVMQLHNWLRAHRRPIIIVMLALFGVVMIARGVGNF